MYEDKLLVGAYFYGKAERLIDIAAFARNLLQQIERITPWSRPYDVSGYTKITSDLPVNEDLSNFNDELFKVWKSSDSVYYDAMSARTLEFSEYHTTQTGLRATFSNFIQCQDESSRVSISLQMGRDHDGLASKKAPCYVLLSIPKFRSGQVNASWAQKVIVENLMHYLIDLVNPYQCAAFSSQNTIYEVDGKALQYKFNWLTYIAEKEVCDLLSDNVFSRQFDKGLWFDFGKDVDSVVASSVREAAEGISRKLIAANLEST